MPLLRHQVSGQTALADLRPPTLRPASSALRPDHPLPTASDKTDLEGTIALPDSKRDRRTGRRARDDCARASNFSCGAARDYGYVPRIVFDGNLVDARSYLASDGPLVSHNVVFLPLSS
jgi:hypothetical protein